MKAKVKPVLPSGFKAISARSDSWVPVKKGESIQGVLVASKIVSFPKQGKKAARDVPVYTITTKDGDVSVWGSAGLKALASVKKKTQIYIEFIGMGKAKPGQSPPKLYVIATK